jgi:hypothetical protein
VSHGVVSLRTSDGSLGVAWTPTTSGTTTSGFEVAK